MASDAPDATMHPIQKPDLDSAYGGEIVPNEYEIGLQEGYSLKDHFASIGHDLTQYLQRVYDDPQDYDHVSYLVRLEDTKFVDAIRRDPKVSYVGLSATFKMISDSEMMPWDESHPDWPGKEDVSKGSDKKVKHKDEL